MKITRRNYEVLLTDGRIVEAEFTLIKSKYKPEDLLIIASMYRVTPNHIKVLRKDFDFSKWCLSYIKDFYKERYLSYQNVVQDNIPF